MKAKRKGASSPPSRNWRWAVGLGAGLFLLNAFLVSPFIGWYDSGEMVGTTVCLGISHPCGQALFHLLGKVFLLLPFGTPAWRLGILSAACAALASSLFFLLALGLAARISGDRYPSTTLKTWTFFLSLAWSLSLPWWRYSLTPLVYGLHLALGMLVLWALSLEKPSKWFLVFFMAGIATVFRPTQFFALPFVGLAFLAESKWDWKRGWAAFPGLLAFFLLGRSSLLYLPLRSALKPAIAYGDLTHPSALFRHVMALRFSHSMGEGSPAHVLHVLAGMASHYWSDLTPLGLALLLAGSALAFRQRTKLPAFLWVGLGWGLLESLFVLTIPFPTFESHQTILGWAYGGLLAALPLGFLERLCRKQRRRFWTRTTGGILAALVLLQFLQVGHLLERRKDRGAEDYARNVLAIMGPQALYMPAEENEYFPVAGFQQSFGFRKDVEVLEPGDSPSRVAPRIVECLDTGRPLYLTRKVALPPGWAYRARGSLLQVVPAASQSAAPASEPRVAPLASWGGIELLGVEIDPPRVKAGEIIQVTYRWARRAKSAQDASDIVAALFIDPHGSYWKKDGVFWLHDIHEPPENPSRMKPGKLYEEKRILFIPSDYPPGDYALAVGLQKQVPPRQEGREPFSREFYERNSYQNLDKFLGRGENGAVVQFSSESSGLWKEGLWPVTRSLYPIADPRFVPAATLEIQPAP